MGRPTKCTPEVRERVVTGILANFPQDVAAARGGIGERTHYQWMARGVAALELAETDDPENVPEGERPFAQYQQAVEEARREWEGRQLAIIARGASGVPVKRTDGEPTDPWEETTVTTRTVDRELRDGSLVTTADHTVTRTTAKRGLVGNTGDAKWMLERRLSQRYGRVWRAEITTPEGETVEKSLDELRDEMLADVDELKERRERRQAHARRQEGEVSENGSDG